MRGGPRAFPQGSSCPVVLWILLPLLPLRLRGSHPLRPSFPGPFCWDSQWFVQSEPRSAPHSGLGSSGSARRYSRNHFCFLFLRLLRCFSSPGSPPYPIRAYLPLFRHGYMESVHVGFPIQRSVDLWIFAPPHGFSQLITSFVGSQCQGILPALFLA